MRCFYVLLCAVLLCSCDAYQVVTATDKTHTDEAFVFGKLTLGDRHEDFPNRYQSVSESQTGYNFIRLRFNNSADDHLLIRPDKDGYFYARLPLGKNYLASVEYAAASYTVLPKNFITIELTDADKVYYIGDIAWKRAFTPFILPRYIPPGGILAMMALKGAGKKFLVMVMNKEKTIQHFQTDFPSNKKQIVTQLVQVNE